jgi:hypothetical protein
MLECRHEFVKETYGFHGFIFATEELPSFRHL